LIRHYREMWGRNRVYLKDAAVIQFVDTQREVSSVPPQYLKYLIDGTWVSYAQLMTGEM
jgi:hypothetical protein